MSTCIENSLSNNAAAIENYQEKARGTFWGATLLIAGTAIGGGMLAMPVQLAEAGFGLSVIGLLVSWAFMTYTGLLLVEATLWIKNGTHFSSLSNTLIGTWAKVIALVVYLFMNYASLIAYTAGGVGLINSWLQAAFGFSFEYVTGCALYTVVFGLIVYSGAYIVGRCNLFLMLGLIFAYIGLVTFGVGIVSAENLAFRPSWRNGIGVFSMILATFSFQMVVPSVCSYVGYDKKTSKNAVIVGTLIPCVAYLLWIFVIHGAVPYLGEGGLQEAYLNGSVATAPLRSRFDHWSLTLFADVFAFVALSTSYLGLSLALFGFLEDCFREIKITLSYNMICIITFVPVVLFASLYPRALLQFLDISGGYGDTILSGMIPVLMVWYGRYKKKLTGEFRVPGGKIGLVAAGLFFFAVLVLQHF